jgi:hypothetical protein
MEDYIDFLNALIDEAEIDDCQVCSMKQAFIDACVELD